MHGHLEELLTAGLVSHAGNPAGRLLGVPEDDRAAPLRQHKAKVVGRKATFGEGLGLVGEVARAALVGRLSALFVEAEVVGLLLAPGTLRELAKDLVFTASGVGRAGCTAASIGRVSSGRLVIKGPP